LKFQTGVVIAFVTAAGIAAGCNIPDAPKTSSSVKPVTTKPGTARPTTQVAKGEKIEGAKAKPAITPADNGPPPTTATSPTPAGPTVQVPAFSGAYTGDPASLPKVDDTKFPGKTGPIRINNSFLDHGDGTSEKVQYWTFEAELAATRQDLTLHQPAPLYQIVDDSGQQIGQTVFSVVPGQPGYSPYWRVFKLHVPSGYIPNSIRSFREVNQALKSAGFWLEDTKLAFNCPVVAEGAKLEGADDAVAQFNWVDGKRAYYFTFDYQKVTEDNGLPTVQTAPIWAFITSDTNPGDLSKGNPKTTEVPIKNYDKALALADMPPLNQDLGAGKGIDLNNIINVWPQTDNPAGNTISTLQYPEKGAYSSLWLVTATVVPENYAFRSLTMLSQLTEAAGFKKEKAPMLVNCPLYETLKKRTTPTALQTPTPTTSASVAPSTAPSTSAVSFKTTIAPLVQQHCARCHNPEGQASFLPLAKAATGNQADHTVISGKVDRMIARISAGEMPKDKATTVTAEQLQALKDWMAQGKANN
jgi:mono/diheme cytochrome c family protein